MITIIKLGLIFPGQGSQYIGMCKALYDQYAVVREVFEEASDILEIDIAQRCFEKEIHKTQNTHYNQINVFVTNVAMHRAYQYEIGLSPAFCAGHSLGEYSALCCAGAIRFSDGLRLVNKRGHIMQEVEDKNDGMMAAVYNISITELEKICTSISTGDRTVVVSNDNSESQQVVSGHVDSVAILIKVVEKMGYKVVPLKVKAAFHSPLFSSVISRFQQVLEECSFVISDIPVISNITTEPYKSASEIKQCLTQHLVTPVSWRKSMQYMIHKGVNCFIEIGPGHSLSRLLKRDNPLVHAYSFDEPRDRTICCNWLESRGGRTKSKILSHMRMCLKHAVCTQNKNWDENEYYAGVIIPYKEMSHILSEAEKERKMITEENFLEMIKHVKKIWETKKVPIYEQNKRLSALNFKIAQ